MLTFESYSSIADLPPTATSLLDRAERGSIQLGASWYALLQESVLAVSGERAVIHVVLRDCVPLMVLPLVLDPSMRRGEVRSFGNFYTAIYLPAIAGEATDDDIEALLRYVRRFHRGARRLRLAPMDPQSSSYERLKRCLTRAGFKVFPYFCFGNWYLRPAKGWNDYLASRPSKRRGELRRMAAKLLHDGGVIEIFTPQKLTPDALKAFEVVYGASWKKPEPFPHFVPGLVALAANRDWLRLGVIRLGDVPIASQIWLVSHGRADIYKVAYDERYKQYSPGTILTGAMLEHVIDVDHVTEVDYLIGDDAYKRNWMDARRERWGIVAYDAASLIGFLGFLREIGGRWLRALSRSRPRKVVN